MKRCVAGLLKFTGYQVFINAFGLKICWYGLQRVLSKVLSKCAITDIFRIDTPFICHCLNSLWHGVPGAKANG